jgi:hypothetical protein
LSTPAFKQTFVELLAGVMLSVHTGGPVKQEIFASHPGLTAEASDLNLKVSLPDALEAVTVPGLLVPA